MQITITVKKKIKKKTFNVFCESNVASKDHSYSYIFTVENSESWS